MSIEKPMSPPVRLNQNEAIKNYENRYKSLIKSANNTSESMPSRLKNKVYNALGRFTESIKTIITKHFTPIPTEKTFVSHIGGVDNRLDKKCEQHFEELPALVPKKATVGRADSVDQCLDKNLVKHFDELFKNKPDVLLVLAPDNMFSENNMPMYFSQPKIQRYGDYSVSSFPSFSGEKDIDSLKIDNRMAFIAKNNESMSIRVIHVTNWSNMYITPESWNKVLDYAGKVSDEKAKLRVDISQINKPKVHNGVTLLHFDDEFAALYSKESELPHDRGVQHTDIK